jgi:hypothetical protein
MEVKRLERKYDLRDSEVSKEDSFEKEFGVTFEEPNDPQIMKGRSNLKHRCCL